MDTGSDVHRSHFSPVWGWAVAGALSFPAVTTALPYLPNLTLIVLAMTVCGAGVVVGAGLAG